MKIKIIIDICKIIIKVKRTKKIFFIYIYISFSYVYKIKGHFGKIMLNEILRNQWKLFYIYEVGERK